MADSPVALVTGAARRVGAAIARALHARGARVAVHYRTSARDADALCAALNASRPDSAMAFAADVCDVSDCRTLIAQVEQSFGRLDVLVNNASSFRATPLASVSEADWDDLVGSNLKGPLFLASAAARALGEVGGSIVNITDIHARHPLPDHAIYCAAKAGLEALTRSLARDLAPRVRVNAVAPGAILWPESRGNAALGGDDARQQIIDSTELKRLGDPKDIASAVSYLTFDADYVTGHSITVDGGRTVGP